MSGTEQRKTFSGEEDDKNLLNQQLWASAEILSTLYEVDRNVYREYMQRELDDLAKKDFTVEIESGRVILRDLREEVGAQPPQPEPELPQEQPAPQQQQLPPPQ
ncbi:unnamed protein product [Mucor hiemalis]